MNSLTVAGNISQAAEVRFLPNGDPVATFSIADNQGKDKKAIFFRCSLFGKRAQSLEQYLQTGQAVTITGSLTEREYVNKDGATVKAQEIRVADVALQGGKRDDAQPAPARQQSRPAPAPAEDFDSDSIPF